jgi:hypothetical protein
MWCVIVWPRVTAHGLFCCLQAVVVSKEKNDATVGAVVGAVGAILREYNARLETGDADDVATLESLAAAIGSASHLDLRECEKFVKAGLFRAVAFTRGTAWRWQVV